MTKIDFVIKMLSLIHKNLKKQKLEKIETLFEKQT